MLTCVISPPPVSRIAPRASGASERGDRYEPSSAPDFVPPTRAQMLQAFPQSWTGRWKGQLSVGAEKIGVELDIRPQGQSGNYTWKLRYQGQPERPYELVPVDPAQGHYLVDEHNGILLDSYYRDGVLMSQFEVDQNRVTARYELEGDQLSLEMNMFGKDPVRESAMGVKAFPMGSLQRAVLTRDA